MTSITVAYSWRHTFNEIYAGLFLCSPSSGTNELWERTENEVLEFTKYRCRSQWEFLKMGWYSLMEILGFDYAYQSLFLIVLGNYNRLHGDMDIPPEAVQYVKAEPINDTRPNLVKYKTLSIMKIPSFSIVITYGDKDIYGPSREAQQQNSM
jgi:proline iminopeptidase